jgi:hypothetical protein
MKNYHLFLDDVRNPEDVTWVKLPECNWIIARSYEEFRTVIWNKGIPKFVSYDHDLSDDHYENYHSIYANGELGIDYDKFTEKTGYDCAKFLVNECNKLAAKHPDYVVHSMNPVGKQNIINYVESYNRIS